MNITYFQVTGTPLRSGNYCYHAMAANDVTNANIAWLQAIRDNSEHLCSNKSFDDHGQHFYNVP